MFPDLITPRAFPELLSKVDYDPYELMPKELPPAPRVFATAGHFERAKARVKAGVAADVYCDEQLRKSEALTKPLPATNRSHDAPPVWEGSVSELLDAAFQLAFEWQVVGDVRRRERALEAMRIAAKISLHTKWSGMEHGLAQTAGCAYDLLAAEPLSREDDRLLRDMLRSLCDGLNHNSHSHCNNHNAMNMGGRLAIAAALGDRQEIHNVLYGFESFGKWRYGLIHLMRHDFLADGMHWEGVTGYHMLVQRYVFECFTIMEHLGVDMWHRQWPSLMQNDNRDEHRGWGPKGPRTLKATLDALIYQSTVNGSHALLHDQVLGNLRSTDAWWPVFQKGYEVYREPRFAWVVSLHNRGKPVRKDEVPSWHGHGSNLTRFVRLEEREIPAGEAPWAEDRDFSLTGRHLGGCSLFPAHGSAVLRSSTSDPKATSVYAYWGPHWAGHRSPAALHVELHA